LPLASGFDPWSVDGIIAHESSPALLSLFGGAGRAPVPVVATGSYHLVPDVDQVILDVSPGSFAAMRHLIDIGRRNIVYLAHDLVHQAQDPRYAAFHQLAAEAGLPPRATNVPSLRGDVRSFVRQYVQETGMPDALFCHNDDIAIAASRALCDLGVKIPDDVAVVGCDGIEETEYLEVPITTVVLPLQQMAKAACECLASRIQDPSIPIREMRLTSELVIRQSTTGIPDKWS
jgi:LacI family transcriptional regulator